MKLVIIIIISIVLVWQAKLLLAREKITSLSHAACMRCFFLLHFFTWVTPGPLFSIFPLVFSRLYVRDFSLIYYIIIFDKIVEFRLPKTVDLYFLSSLIGPYLSYLNILLIVTVSQYSGDRCVLSQCTLKYCVISLCRLANFRTRSEACYIRVFKAV